LYQLLACKKKSNQPYKKTAHQHQTFGLNGKISSLGLAILNEQWKDHDLRFLERGTPHYLSCAAFSAILNGKNSQILHPDQVAGSFPLSQLAELAKELQTV